MANIVGGVTSINNPRTNWAQTDAKKADFLKNKPSVANALKGHKTGVAISASDVSPIEHELDIKITGENVEGTVVKRYGKNLANLLKDYDSGGSNKTDTRLMSGRTGHYCSIVPVIPNTVYKISKETAASGRFRYFYYDRNPIDGTVMSIGGVYNDSQYRGEVTTPANCKYLLVAWGTVLENFQVELGKNYTEFEPYIEPVEAMADAEGNVKGLASLAPSMTLTTDNAGAVIECEYNRDANKVVTDLENQIKTLIETIAG